jgi:signal peptidase I
MQWQVKPYTRGQNRFYRGTSMLGTLRPGDYLIVASVSFNDVLVGDVVVFRSRQSEPDGNEEWVHRVVDIRHGRFVTRGDNNSYNDPKHLTADDFIGKVSHAAHDGKTRLIAGGRCGFLWARCLHARRPLIYLLRYLLGRYYRWLKTSMLIPRLWKPSLVKLSLMTNDGRVVKYLHRGCTVAFWWLEKHRFVCRRPFDLVIPSPLDEKQSGI